MYLINKYHIFQFLYIYLFTSVCDLPSRGPVFQGARKGKLKTIQRLETLHNLKTSLYYRITFLAYFNEVSGFWNSTQTYLNFDIGKYQDTKVKKMYKLKPS